MGIFSEQWSAPVLSKGSSGWLLIKAVLSWKRQSALWQHYKHNSRWLCDVVTVRGSFCLVSSAEAVLQVNAREDGVCTG